LEEIFMSSVKEIAVLDAEHKEKSYRGLAHHYAKNGNTWMAVHAQATADVAALTVALNQRFNFVDAAAALSDGGVKTAGDSSDAKHAVEQFRIFLAERLTEEQRAAWRARLAPLAYLEGLPAISPDWLRETVSARFDELDPADFVSTKMADAVSHMSKATVLLSEGREWEAIEACYESDLNVFEGWLINRSIFVKDTEFVQTEMRWALAVAVLESLSSLPTDFSEAAAVVRSRLVWVVGPNDAEDLADHFLELP